jgi:hypothetical protein
MVTGKFKEKSLAVTLKLIELPHLNPRSRVRLSLIRVETVNCAPREPFAGAQSGTRALLHIALPQARTYVPAAFAAAV